MNTKAASILLWIFEVVAVIAVIVIALTIAKQFSDETALRKINAAEDIAMMVNTLVALPGDALVEYPRDLSKFSVALTPQHVIIFEKDAKIDGETRNFILPSCHAATETAQKSCYTAVGIVEHKAKVCLKKSGKTIFVEDCLKP